MSQDTQSGGAVFNRDGSILNDPRDRIRGRLADLKRRARGDQDLNPDMVPSGPLREAAVLLPIVADETGHRMLFTRRSDHLAVHAGQISFPGGRLDSTDVDAVAAALRETEEETGIPRDRVDVLGTLDAYVSRTGFQIVPVIGFIQGPVATVPCPIEVAEIFDVPLAHLLNPANRRLGSRQFEGKDRHFHVFEYRDRVIWGVTAGILVHFCDMLGNRW